jgi:hypothetical protein
VHPSHGHDRSILNGISRIGYMTGGKAALWKDEILGDTFLGKAKEFIEKNQRQPSFPTTPRKSRTFRACRIRVSRASPASARAAM